LTNIGNLNENQVYLRLFEKMLNILMKDGKKKVARKLLKNALTIASSKVDKSESFIFQKALHNLSPDVKIQNKRVGSTTYQIPVALTEEQKLNRGIKILVATAKLRKERTMEDRLALEIIDAFNQRGLTIKKKDEIHKLAEANKSYAHFSW
jgi:small subunit ribosomal protein S7